MDAGSHSFPAHLRNISAVIFDYGEVLCHPPSNEHLARMAGAFRIPREEFLSVYVASQNPYDRGDVRAEEYWRRFAESAGVDMDDSMIERLRQWDLEMWTSINTKMVEWLGAIHTAGFKTAMLSEHAIRHGRPCAKNL
jgi:FMN phosphatase YigB (HAD superfamily)